MYSGLCEFCTESRNVLFLLAWNCHSLWTFTVSSQWFLLDCTKRGYRSGL